MTLSTASNFAKPDDAFRAVVEAHRGLSDEQSADFDAAGLARKRYDAEPGTAYLLRPDGYVAARFRHPTRPALNAALARASGLI